MFGSHTLEVAIGVVLLFLFMSVVSTAAMEGIAALLKLRAADLARGIKELLASEASDKELEDFYQHPQIFALFLGSNTKNKPSYIPAANFAIALIDLAAAGKLGTASASLAHSPQANNPVVPATPPGQAPAGGRGALDPRLATLRVAVENITNEKIKRALLNAIDFADGSLDDVKKNLENWFDSSMDRVSGWYKRRSQAILFALGLLGAIAFNVDAVFVALKLSSDDTLRAAVVTQAETPELLTTLRPAATADANTNVGLREALDEFTTVGFPVGWPPQQPAFYKEQWHWADGFWMNVLTTLAVLVGWLITALAVMVGAPFWFDILNKFMVIRSTVKPKKKSPEEGSEDRQPAVPQTK